MDVKQIKPIISVVDTKPVLKVVDTKPVLKQVFGETVVYYQSSGTIYAGSPMGLLLAITYPVDIASSGVRP
jgi:hypothetical protein